LNLNPILIIVLQKFLSQFGYLKPLEKNQGSENIMFEDPTTTALKKFQSFFGLNPTGEYVVLSDSIKNHLRN